MRNLLRFIIKNHFGIVFILLEILALILLVNNNNYHQTRYFNMIQKIDASFHQMSFRIKQYIHLVEENEKLVNENLKLRSQISNISYELETIPTKFSDSLFIKNYIYIPAKVINNSTNKQYNYITLNKGEKDGIENEMAVISPDGVVGKVIRTSKNYSIVISLLNRELFSVSSKIKSSNYYGPVSWEGENYRRAYLNDIPYHVIPKIGDTIVTSGLTKEFPENILVGQVIDYIQEGNNLKISIQLATDFKKLTNVYVIKNLFKEEIEILENEQ